MADKQGHRLTDTDSLGNMLLYMNLAIFEHFYKLSRTDREADGQKDRDRQTDRQTDRQLFFSLLVHAGSSSDGSSRTVDGGRLGRARLRPSLLLRTGSGSRHWDGHETYMRH